MASKLHNTTIASTPAGGFQATCGCGWTGYPMKFELDAVFDAQSHRRDEGIKARDALKLSR